MSESVCMRKRAEGKSPTQVRRGWSEGPEWGVWSAKRSAKDKKRAAKSDETELDSARRLIILR